MKPTFLLLIQMYNFEGMVALGKVLNPATNQLSKSLEHAKYVIDILEVLKEKTRGNLDSEESRLLDQTLSSLKLNYVDEMGNPDAPSTTESLA
jgi:hypothetical protein